MKVSVIVSIYNGSEYIERFIDALKQQTFTDFETLFVIDSKSCDGSIGITYDLIRDLPNSRIIIQTDDGRLGASRNIGLDESVGELIWFADIDDVPNKEFLNIMVRMLEDNDADVSVCNFTYSIAPKKRLHELSYDRNDVKTMTRLEALHAKSHEKIPVQVWSKLVKRSLIMDNGIRFDSGYAEDIKFTYKVLSKANKVCYYTRSIYSYQQNPLSASNDPERKDSRGRGEISAYNDLEEYFANNEFLPEFKVRSGLVRIRSSGHMSFRGFMEYHRSEECRELIKRTIPGFRPHVLWYRFSPRTYYFAEQVFFKLFYYRDGKDYS